MKVEAVERRHVRAHPRAAGRRSRSRRTGRWPRSGRCSRTRSRATTGRWRSTPPSASPRTPRRTASAIRRTASWSAWSPRCSAGATAPGQFLLMLLLTGARRGELLALRWSDVDLEAGVWTKPAEVTKQRKSHRLPLNPQAVEMLRGAARGRAVLARSGGSALSAIRAAWSRGAARRRDRRICASTICGIGMRRCWPAWAVSLPIIGALLGPREHGDDAAIRAPGRRRACARRPSRSARRAPDAQGGGLSRGRRARLDHPGRSGRGGRARSSRRRSSGCGRFCSHQTNEVVRLLMAEAQRGRPRVRQRRLSLPHQGSGTARRQRAELAVLDSRDAARQRASLMLWNLTTGECRPLTPRRSTREPARRG